MTGPLLPSEVTVFRLSAYTPEIAAGLGALLPQVWEGYSGYPMPKEDLEFIVNAHDRVQIVATRVGQVVGMATVTLHISPSGKEGWLNDLVTSPDPEIRGQGVGRALFEEALRWCGERQVNLAFTAMDAETHGFYEKMGAVRDYETTRFSATPHDT